MEENTSEILELAIKKYGWYNQMDMCIEECAELIQSINKIKRFEIHTESLFPLQFPNEERNEKYRMAYFNLCSEIADVKIMIMQMELMFNKETIDISFNRKIERLKNNLNKKP